MKFSPGSTHRSAHFSPAILIALSLAILSVSGRLQAVEFFVDVKGSDSADGRTPATAFATIQKGVDALASGDTLTIAPGEYFEHVLRKDLGDLEKDTVIRAAVPGSVLMRGDVPMPELKAVEGFRFVFSAQVAKKPVAVMEVDTLQNLAERFGRTEIEFQPGTWYYDSKEQTLYLSSSDLEAPLADRFRISLTPVSGFILENPRRVIVEGLGFTGYYPAEKKKWPYTNYVGGLTLIEPIRCVVRDCTPFLNGQGICLIGGQGNTVERCVAYGNGSPYHDQGGNLIRYLGKDDLLRDNLSYASAAESIKFYSGFTGPVLLQGNISWGAWADYYIKGEGAGEFGLAERNVGLGVQAVKNVQNNLFGGTNHYNHDMSLDNVMLPGLDRDKEFADFLNLDFRLQGNSSLRGSGPDGKDRGPFPYRANIFYVSPTGDDSKDGLSTATAWKTLEWAMRQLKAGDTLYLSGGTYAAPPVFRLGSGNAGPVRICGRGTDTVFLQGPVSIEAGGRVQFARLAFLNPVKAEGNLDFTQCRFLGAEEGLSVKNSGSLRVTQCEFTGFHTAGLVIRGEEKKQTSDGSAVFLSGNIFDNVQAPAVRVPSTASVRYCDYNSYRSPAVCWRVDGRHLRLEDVQKSHDSNSRIIVPDFQTADGAITLKNTGDFLAMGPLGKPLGNYPTFPTRPARLAGPFVHSVTDTTANIEWWTAQMARCEVSWGESPDTMQSKWLFTSGYGALSLTGLKPGTKYYFKVLQVDPSVNPVPFRNFYPTEFEENIIGSKKFIYELPYRPDSAVVSFETSKDAPRPKTYFVATDGDDSHSGMSRAEAWRSINQAASKVTAGDTVLIAGGIYQETVWMRAGGDRTHPIRFGPVPGERVIMDGANGSLSNSFILRGKNFVNIDGFTFQAVGFGRDVPASIDLYESNDIRISRCLMDGRKISYSAPFLVAWACANLDIQNCVVIQAMNYGISLVRCPDALIEHSVFFRNYVNAADVVNKADEKVRFESCVFTDLTVGKEMVPLISLPEMKAFSQRNNLFVLRTPGRERAPVFYFYRSDGKLKLTEYFDQKGADGSLEGDPLFQGGLALKRTANSTFLPDDLIQKPELGFADFFVTRPDFVEKGIGLQRGAFADFGLDQPTP